ncbi:hypothetical protein O181_016437 [Austropuccinia psidii MF-1]|uniref:Uncharacterized protein n=1 Tax=Austropuccinia psidii MF-1 TaxID=1389203 RepID=A0A9Q3C407_9BASI|nr:hypothetical protein [Austropuccinia psidii MF-1]
MENRRFNLASQQAELEEGFQNICLKEIDFKDFIVTTNGWKHARQFTILAGRANSRRENQANIQAIEEHLPQIPPGSQGVCQPVTQNQSTSMTAKYHKSMG